MTETAEKAADAVGNAADAALKKAISAAVYPRVVAVCSLRHCTCARVVTIVNTTHTRAKQMKEPRKEARIAPMALARGVAAANSKQPERVDTSERIQVSCCCAAAASHASCVFILLAARVLMAGLNSSAVKPSHSSVDVSCVMSLYSHSLAHSIKRQEERERDSERHCNTSEPHSSNAPTTLVDTCPVSLCVCASCFFSIPPTLMAMLGVFFVL